jgi:hypothetical protein
MKTTEILFIVALTAIAAYMRLHGLSEWVWNADDAFTLLVSQPIAPPFNFDYTSVTELWTYPIYAAGRTPLDIAQNITSVGHPPIYYLLLHIAQYISTDMLWLRSLSFVPSILTIPLAYMLGRKIGGATVAAAMGALVAFSPEHIILAQELRSYSLFIFVIFLWMLIAIALQTRQTTAQWCAYAACAALSLMINLTAVYIIATFGIIIALRVKESASPHRAAWVAWCTMHGIFAAAFLLCYTASREAVGQVTQNAQMMWDGWIINLQHLAYGFFSPDPILRVELVLIACLIMASIGLYRLRKDQQWNVTFAIGGIFLLCVLASIAGSQPAFSGRHLSYLFPFLIIAMGYALKGPPRLAAGIMVLCIIAGCFHNYLNSEFIREKSLPYRLSTTRAEWQEATTAINQNAADTDVLLLSWSMWTRVVATTTEPLPTLFTSGRYFMCALDGAVYHLPLHTHADFSTCATQAVARYPDARNLWVFDQLTGIGTLPKTITNANLQNKIPHYKMHALNRSLLVGSFTP